MKQHFYQFLFQEPEDYFKETNSNAYTNIGEWNPSKKKEISRIYKI
jgi:hypothetical protein